MTKEQGRVSGKVVGVRPYDGYCGVSVDVQGSSIAGLPLHGIAVCAVDDSAEYQPVEGDEVEIVVPDKGRVFLEKKASE